MAIFVTHLQIIDAPLCGKVNSRVHLERARQCGHTRGQHVTQARDGRLVNQDVKEHAEFGHCNPERGDDNGCLISRQHLKMYVCFGHPDPT